MKSASALQYINVLEKGFMQSRKLERFTHISSIVYVNNSTVESSTRSTEHKDLYPKHELTPNKCKLLFKQKVTSIY